MYAERHIEEVKIGCENLPPCALTNDGTMCEVKIENENDDGLEWCTNASEEECSAWQCNTPSTPLSSSCGGRPSICDAMNAQIQWFTPSAVNSEYFGIPWIVSTVLNDPMSSQKSWLVDLCQKDKDGESGDGESAMTSTHNSITTATATIVSSLPCFDSCIYTGSGYVPRIDVCRELSGREECSAAGCVWLSDDFEDQQRGVDVDRDNSLDKSSSSLQITRYEVGGALAACFCVSDLVGWGVWTRRRRRRRRQEEGTTPGNKKSSPSSFPKLNSNNNTTPSRVSLSATSDGVVIDAFATATTNERRSSPSKDSAMEALTDKDSTGSLNTHSSSKSLHADVKPWEISHVDLDLTSSKIIGSGSFGKVVVARYQETLVAVKYLLLPASVLSALLWSPTRGGDGDGDGGDLGGNFVTSNIVNEESSMVATLSSPKAAALREECQILASLRHPNVVQFMAYSIQPPAIITEYCSRGSLYDRLKETRQGGSGGEAARQQLPWQRRLNMLLDAAKGMLYLHTRNVPIIHKDLKSPNLLVESSWRVKVTDFNLSKFIEHEQIGENSGGDCGTDTGNDSNSGPNNPRWLAPEIMSGASGFTFATDVYAFGVVMYEMLTFQVPWSTETIDTKPHANTTTTTTTTTSTSTTTTTTSISAAAAAKNNNKNNSTSGKNNSQGSWQIISWLLEGQRPRVPDELAGGRFEGIDRYTALMERCWAQDAESRPTFAEVVPELRSIAMAVMAAQKKTAM